MKYLEDAKRIWKEFVPQSGQAETVQGELLRAVEKLRDEAIRNGNCNWDAGFEILLTFLENHLLDDRIYPADVLARTRATLLRLRDFENLLLDDEPYDELGDRVVEYHRNQGSKPHARNPSLHR